MSKFLRVFLILIVLLVASMVVPFMVGDKWGTEDFGTTAFGVLAVDASFIVMFGVMINMMFDVNILED